MYFINLTNGLEYLDKLDNQITNPHFIRIQSTLLEQQRLKSVILNLTDDFLFYASIGEQCIIVDYGSRYRNGIPRAIWQGIPWISYVLNRYWFNKEPEKILCREINCLKYFQERYNTLDEEVFKKIRYFKKYALINKKQEVDISYIANKTIHDSDNDYYVNIANKLRGNT